MNKKTKSFIAGSLAVFTIAGQAMTGIGMSSAEAKITWDRRPAQPSHASRPHAGYQDPQYYYDMGIPERVSYKLADTMWEPCYGGNLPGDISIIYMPKQNGEVVAAWFSQQNVKQGIVDIDYTLSGDDLAPKFREQLNALKVALTEAQTDPFSIGSVSNDRRIRVAYGADAQFALKNMDYEKYKGDKVIVIWPQNRP